MPCPPWVSLTPTAFAHPRLIPFAANAASLQMAYSLYKWQSRSTDGEDAVATIVAHPQLIPFAANAAGSAVCQACQRSMASHTAIDATELHCIDRFLLAAWPPLETLETLETTEVSATQRLMRRCVKHGSALSYVSVTSADSPHRQHSGSTLRWRCRGQSANEKSHKT